MGRWRVFRVLFAVPRRTAEAAVPHIFYFMALLKARLPPTTGRFRVVASRLMVSSVPGSGQRVKSRSLEKIMRAICCPTGMIWSSGCRGKVSW